MVSKQACHARVAASPPSIHHPPPRFCRAPTGMASTEGLNRGGSPTPPPPRKENEHPAHLPVGGQEPAGCMAPLPPHKGLDCTQPGLRTQGRPSRWLSTFSNPRPAPQRSPPPIAHLESPLSRY